MFKILSRALFRDPKVEILNQQKCLQKAACDFTSYRGENFEKSLDAFKE
jgi:hypothetical protein